MTQPPNFDKIFLGFPIASIVLNEEMQVTMANPAAEEIFQYSFKQMSGKGLPEFCPECESITALASRAFAESRPFAEYDVSIRNRLNQSFAVNLRVSPLYASYSSRPEHVLVCISDLAVVKKLSSQERKSDDNKEASLMGAMLAHEINNPLLGIKGAAQLLEPSVNDSDRKLIKLIVSETERINALLRQVEFFDGGKSLAKEPVNLHEILKAASSIIKHSNKNILFSESYDPSLPEVNGNREMLIQAFLNIIKNSADAVGKDGHIRLRTSFEHSSGFRRKTEEGYKNLSIKVSVEDNGPGIPDEVSDKIFKPFISTKESGTGLGLAITANIINDHDGIIEFTSNPGQTCFDIYLLPIT